MVTCRYHERFKCKNFFALNYWLWFLSYWGNILLYLFDSWNKIRDFAAGCLKYLRILPSICDIFRQERGCRYLKQVDIQVMIRRASLVNDQWSKNNTYDWTVRVLSRLTGCDPDSLTTVTIEPKLCHPICRNDCIQSDSWYMQLCWFYWWVFMSKYCYCWPQRKSKHRCECRTTAGHWYTKIIAVSLYDIS